ncbi:hypothetical protein SADUNF_Sadunf19G0050300 [Salix dunnii]|uniref:Uncharacterized protein n=1 Tax=Salix dunnii TaxID=1413687 RepID=A0A835MHN8_9ROSI|nr:hypothetical protein SADUNF_Sadunf19G0050300 [Salix dunnii]
MPAYEEGEASSKLLITWKIKIQMSIIIPRTLKKVDMDDYQIQQHVNSFRDYDIGDYNLDAALQNPYRNM